MDKMWDALHFLLTGVSASMPIEGNAISEAVVGETVISGEEDDEFVAETSVERVKVISEALQKVDIQAYLDKIDLKNFEKNEIYPNIWGYAEEKEEIIEELRGHFEKLKSFYKEMAEKDAAVLVSIY